MTHHGKGLVAGEDPPRQWISKIFGLGHVPGIGTRQEGGHHRWIERAEMVSAHDEWSVARHVFEALDLEEADQEDAGEKAHQPSHEGVKDHLRCRTLSRILSTTWSRSEERRVGKECRAR